MKKGLILIALVLLSFNCFAQYETETHIAWQPNVKLTFDMFQKSEPTETDLKGMQSDNRSSVPYLGFYRALDVPKKRNGWKKGQFEKAYFCATFSKFLSYMAERDTFDLQLAQAQWDILELATRKSRAMLADLQHRFDSISNGPTSGIVSLFYETAYQEGYDFFTQASYIFLKEVVVPRDKEQFLMHREELDNLLEEMADYATTPEEAERLLYGKPLEKYLTPAKTFIGDLRNKSVSTSSNK